jgi:hypothetical protein
MINKQSIFSLADVITLVMVIFYGYFSFLGALFLNINNETVWGMSKVTGCMFISLFCALPLLLTAWGAKVLKGTTKNHSERRLFEVVFLVLFGLFSLFLLSSYSPFIHYFTVSNRDTSINDKINRVITNSEAMFDHYESLVDRRIFNYQGKLRAVVEGGSYTQLEDYKISNANVSNEEKVKTRIEIMRFALLPPHYSDSTTQNGIKQVAMKWLGDAKQIPHKWRPIGLVSLVPNIERNISDWEQLLKTLYEDGIQPGENVEPEQFDYNVRVVRLSSDFTLTDSPRMITIMFALFLNLLMLLSWFMTKRDRKGYSKLKPYEVEL